MLLKIILKPVLLSSRYPKRSAVAREMHLMLFEVGLGLLQFSRCSTLPIHEASKKPSATNRLTFDARCTNSKSGLQTRRWVAQSSRCAGRREVLTGKLAVFCNWRMPFSTRHFWSDLSAPGVRCNGNNAVRISSGVKTKTAPTSFWSALTRSSGL